MVRGLLLAGLCALAACQPVTMQRGEGPVPVTVRVDDAAYWLEEWHRVINLPADKLQMTLQKREREFEKNANPRTRLRLVLLLTTGPKPVRDQGRAQRLLKNMEKDQASESANALAALLKQIIGEQSWAGDKIAELRAKSKEAETRIQELERQLQELTNIEQSIQQRD